MDNAQVTGLGDLGQYIQHKHNCTLSMRMGKECECGLTDTLARHRLERSEPVAEIERLRDALREIATVDENGLAEYTPQAMVAQARAALGDAS